MQAAGQNESEGRELLAGGLRHPFLPTCPLLKRRVERPSTPKGVGRYAPLTATRHDAKDAGMSADQGRHSVAGGGAWRELGRGISGAASRRKLTGRMIEAGQFSGGRGCGRTRELSVRSHLALRCGWRRTPAADHAPSPCELHMDGERSWSAAGVLMLVGEPGGCERGRAGVRGAGRGRIEECGGAGRGRTKLGRNVVGLRLVGGWWS
jgi:hypothetical protein